MKTQRIHGFTLLETLIVVALVGTLLGVGFVSFRRPAVRAFTNDVRALMQQARFDAVKRNRPVLVQWVAGDDGDDAFQSSLATIGSLCTADQTLGSAGMADYGDLTVMFPSGQVALLWLPNGQARNCTLGSFPSLIAEVTDGNVTQDIRVSVTGRVTIE